jgi:hypothetical protein
LGGERGAAERGKTCCGSTAPKVATALTLCAQPRRRSSIRYRGGEAEFGRNADRLPGVTLQICAVPPERLIEDNATAPRVEHSTHTGMEAKAMKAAIVREFGKPPRIEFEPFEILCRPGEDFSSA